MFPDAIFSIVCGSICIANAFNGSQTGLETCNVQMVIAVWGVGSNMWLNAAVSRELHKLLKDSLGFHHYKVPTRRYVTTQALSIYAFCFFLGTWGLIESPKFPHYAVSTSGLACLPLEQDRTSSLFFWMVFFPLFGGIPTAYVLYVPIDIWRRKLLPPRGKRRQLSLYYGRIVVVFISMWIPFLVVDFMFGAWMPLWLKYLGGTLSHLQGITSALICLHKPDIYIAEKKFFTCQSCRKSDDLALSVPSDPATQPNGDQCRRNSWLLGFFSTGSHSLSFRRHSVQSVGEDSHIAPSSNDIESITEVDFDESEFLWPAQNGDFVVYPRRGNENVVFPAENLVSGAENRTGTASAIEGSPP
jgi:hypothetical protein